MNHFFYKYAKFFSSIPLQYLINLTGKYTIYPFYHLVSDVQVDHIKHLYSIRKITEFEKDLDFLLKYYKPIGLEEFVSIIKSGSEVPKKHFVLSFDDGLREFYEIVAPILKRKGVPAICFLNSGFVDNKDLFFRYKASILYEKLVSSATENKKNRIIDWCRERNISYNGSYKFLFLISYNDRQYLDEISEILDISFSNYLLQHQPYMTKEQVINLQNQVFFIGAHSIDHPKYLDLSNEEQLRQTIESINFITKAFNIDYKLFSFPFTDFGVSKDFFVKAFRKEGFNIDATFGTAGIKNDTFKKNIQRFPMEIENFSAQEIIQGEYLYYIFKSLMNKNIIRRI